MHRLFDTVATLNDAKYAGTFRVQPEFTYLQERKPLWESQKHSLRVVPLSIIQNLQELNQRMIFFCKVGKSKSLLKAPREKKIIG